MSIPHGFHLWSASLVVLIGAAVVDQVSGQPKPLPLAEARPSRVDAFGDPLPDGALARLGTVRFRHGNAIHALAISPDGKIIASASHGTIDLWDAASGKRLHRLEVSDWWIYSLAFLPDGKTLVSPEGDKSILFWDIATGKLIRRLANSCHYVAIAPDGKTMATADRRSVIRILDVASGKQLHQLQGRNGHIYALVFSPDGATLAWGGGDNDKNNHLHLTDVKTGKELRRCQGKGWYVRSLAFSPDGETLASAGSLQPIRLWEVSTGKEVRQIGKVQLGGPILFAADGKTLISGHDDGSIAVWETASGKELRRWPADHNSILHLALDADGGTLVAGGGAGLVRLWDMKTGKELGPAPGKLSAIAQWTFAADGKTLVSLCLDGTLRHWDAATGQERRQMPGPGGWVRFAFAPGGRELVTLTRSHMFHLRQTDTGKERWQFPDKGQVIFHGLQFSPDGNILVTGLWGTKLLLLETATGKERCQLVDGVESHFQYAAFAPDGKLLITSHWQSRLDDGTSSTIRIPFVNRLSFWNVSTGKKINSIDGKWEYGLHMSVSRDGRMLALPNPDGSVSLWELATKKERLRSPIPQTAPKAWFQPASFLFSPDGGLLFMGEDSNRLLVRETATGKSLPPVVVHDGWVRDMGFTADGKTLAALGKDGTILLWDAAHLCRRPAEAARKLSAKELDSLWLDLAAEDAPRAWKAIGTLASSPAPAIALLMERLTPAPPPDAPKIARMIADLGSDDFQQRAKATRDLENLGDVAEPALRQALQTKAPLEMRRRIETLLARVEAQILTGDALREVRALEALETIGTPEACQLLTRLAKGSPAALLTREAQATLQRLARRTVTLTPKG